ncbi:MAG TPA: hypothetical protein VKT76_03840 [Bradyrhizobium sp.]|nr:hypothetical protein [Bradyrhizobium sp.]
MLRKTMIALCAVASVGLLTPDVALARGGGHGGGGGGHGGGGGRAGGSFGGGGFAARGGNFSNSFARVTPNAGIQGNRFASGNWGRGFDRDRRGFDRDRDGFRRGRGFFGGGFVWDNGWYDGYWGYPNYAYDDSYYYNEGCYVVRRHIHTAYGWRWRPVQVCG